MRYEKKQNCTTALLVNKTDLPWGRFWKNCLIPKGDGDGDGEEGANPEVCVLVRNTVFVGGVKSVGLPHPVVWATQGSSLP